MTGCIYLVTDQCGKRYVGMTKHTPGARWRAHLAEARLDKSTSYLHSAIRKHGAAYFEVTLLEGGVEFNQLSTREVWWIANLNTLHPGGYNLTSGGEGVISLPPEVEALRVAKSAASRTGLKLSDPHRRNLSLSHIGRPNPDKGKRRTADQVSNMKRAALARWADPDKRAAALLAIHSSSATAKRRASLTGVPHTEKRKRNQSKAQKKRYKK